MSQPSTHIRPASPEDFAGLSVVLSCAFEEDPLQRWFVLQDQRRRERQIRLFSWFLREAIPHGCVYTTDSRCGAAVWMPPGTWKLPLIRQFLLLPEVLRIVGFGRALSRIHGNHTFQRLHPTTPHYYLATLGVEPEHQGKGYGSRLMQPILSRCDDTGTPAYLETATERNLPLYERHGFRTTAEVRVGRSGPRLWLMWREPDDPIAAGSAPNGCELRSPGAWGKGRGR